MLLDTWRANPGDSSRMPAPRARSPLELVVEKITVYELLTLPNFVEILGNPVQIISTVINSVDHIATAVQGPDRRISVP